MDCRRLMIGEFTSIMTQVQCLSPPVLMHGGLLGVAFCQSVCPPMTNTRKKVNGKKFIPQKLLDLWSPDFVWSWTWTISKFCVKLRVLGQRSRSQC